MLTVVSHNKENNLKVVKRSNNGIVYEYQVHDTTDALNPLRDSFSTKAKADECIGVNLKKEPEKKSKRSK